MNEAAHWTVPADHPALAGHFPGSPILPGVLLLDLALHEISAATGIALEFCELDPIKFLSPARPGDALMIRHQLMANGTIRFEIVSGLRKIAGGSIVPGSGV